MLGENMNKYLITAFFIFLASTSFQSARAACDLYSDINFGITSDQLVSKFNINNQFSMLGFNPSGESHIHTHGSLICSDLPKQSIVDFKFTDNKLVSFSTIVRGNDGWLMNYAKQVFGDPDKKKYVKRSIKADASINNSQADSKPQYKINQKYKPKVKEIWDKKSHHYYVMYETLVHQYIKSTADSERLEIIYSEKISTKNPVTRKGIYPVSSTNGLNSGETNQH